MSRARVLLESPYAGDVPGNVEYARKCMRDSVERGEAPFASHLLYTQILDDNNPEERTIGIDMGLTWGEQATRTVCYIDRGVTRGMWEGIVRARSLCRPIILRSLRRPGEALTFSPDNAPSTLAELTALIKRAGWP